LTEAAGRYGVEVHVLAPGEDLRAVAEAAVAAGADAVGVAGGDGSLGAVAAVAVRAGLPFLCIPTGTRNHFAADLGLDRSRPLDALDGRERRIDVGTVGGRTFLTTSRSARTPSWSGSRATGRTSWAPLVHCCRSC
jgi:diacylglycerol kinase family enzyme